MKCSSSASLLVVQDDLAISAQLERYLFKEGFKVRLVTRVQEAEEALPESPELMLVDLHLRGGAEWCRRVRPYVQSGIVVCSGLSDRKLRLDSLRSGVDACLTKPLDLR